MKDIFDFHQLVKAMYPSLHAAVSIQYADSQNRVALAEYKVVLTGSALFVPVEVIADSAASAAAKLKAPTAKSRREKEARGVLSECVRRASGHLDDDQREALLAELMQCPYHKFQDVAASCRSRAVAIGRANLESDHYQLARS